MAFRKIGSTFVIKKKEKTFSFTTKTQMEILGQTKNQTGLLKSSKQKTESIFSGKATGKMLHI